MTALREKDPFPPSLHTIHNCINLHTHTPHYPFFLSWNAAHTMPSLLSYSFTPFWFWSHVPNRKCWCSLGPSWTQRGSQSHLLSTERHFTQATTSDGGAAAFADSFRPTSHATDVKEERSPKLSLAGKRGRRWKHVSVTQLAEYANSQDVSASALWGSWRETITTFNIKRLWDLILHWPD